jgi:hypothetical protein
VQLTAHPTKHQITQKAGRPPLENQYLSLRDFHESRHTEGMDSCASCEPNDIENVMSCQQDDVALGEDTVDVENPPLNQELSPSSVENEPVGSLRPGSLVLNIILDALYVTLVPSNQSM